MEAHLQILTFHCAASCPLSPFILPSSSLGTKRSRDLGAPAEQRASAAWTLTRLENPQVALNILE